MIFTVNFADNDPHSERNGPHQPVVSGAAFIAEYGDELTYDAEPLTADDIDTLEMGDSIDVEGAWGEVITVARVHPATLNAAPALLASLVELMDVMDDGSDEPTLVRARRVIAKATAA